MKSSRALGVDGCGLTVHDAVSGFEGFTGLGHLWTLKRWDASKVGYKTPGFACFTAYVKVHGQSNLMSTSTSSLRKKGGASNSQGPGYTHKMILNTHICIHM